MLEYKMIHTILLFLILISTLNFAPGKEKYVNLVITPKAKDGKCCTRLPKQKQYTVSSWHLANSLCYCLVSSLFWFCLNLQVELSFLLQTNIFKYVS